MPDVGQAVRLKLHEVRADLDLGVGGVVHHALKLVVLSGEKNIVEGYWSRRHIHTVCVAAMLDLSMGAPRISSRM